MAPPFGYSKYERFAVAAERGRVACENAGHDPEDHFRGASKVNFSGRRSVEVSDVHLTRFGAYLVAMNGDPRKLEIAAARTSSVMRFSCFDLTSCVACE
ncbi:hypothetical protein CcI49_17035 [Frankia sp. CcI49]|uniref:hypothetical protein n=1 Tax=Frankia sp. CcI49 TaxID=1745382 RepID=UPI00097721CC|nr:hypothetical protein [Frankia sp. CcI49]ONH59646.1 hypothetical protein CcI49_17035 [Frankia sp. CcI49]